jgi:hypothetical protein
MATPIAINKTAHRGRWIINGKHAVTLARHDAKRSKAAIEWSKEEYQTNDRGRRVLVIVEKREEIIISGTGRAAVEIIAKLIEIGEFATK